MVKLKKYIMLFCFSLVGWGCQDTPVDINAIKSEIYSIQGQRKKIQQDLENEKRKLTQVKNHIHKLNKEHLQTKKEHINLTNKLKSVNETLEKTNYVLFEQSCRAKLSEIQAYVNKEIAICSYSSSVYYACKAKEEKQRSGDSLFGALLGAAFVVLTGGTGAAILLGGAGGALVGESSTNISCNNVNQIYKSCVQRIGPLKKQYEQERTQVQQLPKNPLYSTLQTSQKRNGILGLLYNKETMKIEFIKPCSGLLYKGYTPSSTASDYIHKINGVRIHNSQEMIQTFKNLFAGDTIYFTIKRVYNGSGIETYLTYAVMLGQME